MKSLLVMILLFTLVSSNSIAQNIMPMSECSPTYNEFGDPLTNIIDENGAQQGKWYYQDIYKNPILLKEFKDHKCIDSFYPYSGDFATIVWTNKSEWESDAVQIDQLKNEIKSLINQINLVLKQSNQQLALIFSKKGELTRFAPIGNWDLDYAKSIENKFREQINSINLNFNNDTFILI